MNSYSLPTPAIISTHLSFGGDDHEGDRYRCDHDADDDVVGQGLAKDQGADQNGRDRLEYAQNGCLGGTDVTGGNGQCGGRDDGGQNGQSNQIEPIQLALDACRQYFARGDHLAQEDN